MISAEENTRRPDETLRELLAGIVAVGIVGQIICLIFFSNHYFVQLSVCWWCGIVVSLFWAIHMYLGLGRALGLSEGDAISLIRTHAIIRYLVAAAGMIVVYFIVKNTDRSCALAYAIGIFSLKVGAYAQPMFHRLFVFLGLSLPYPKGEPLLEDSEDGTDEPANI